MNDISNLAPGLFWKFYIGIDSWYRKRQKWKSGDEWIVDLWNVYKNVRNLFEWFEFTMRFARTDLPYNIAYKQSNIKSTVVISA